MRRYYDDFEDAYFRQISININRGKYRYIGKGSGRIVYDMGNGLVIKAAKNRKGIAQNMEEYRISLVDDSGLFARVLTVSNDYRFLIMDKAERIKDISYVWKCFRVRSNNELYQVSEIRDLSEKYNLLIWDFGRAVNWGQIDGRPMIIDYGFTRQVRRRYYKNAAIGLRRWN